MLHEDDREADVCIAQINFFFCFIHQINTLPLTSDKYYKKNIYKITKKSLTTMLWEFCFQEKLSNYIVL
jgi:hypothetical protein